PLVEKHLLVNGQPIAASLFDFGLAFFHTAAARIAKGSWPYFYLPKLESHLEARLWNDVFNFAQDTLGVPRGTIRATVLIETILAAFETDEILWELRDHSAGLNCGRWDYIFSYIKKFRHRPECVLPDRGAVTMDRPFLQSYAELAIRTCHRRGIHALGGMAAQIPIKRDPALNAQALAKVRQHHLREGPPGDDGPRGPPRHPRARRDGGPDPHQARPRAERAGARKGAAGQAARGAAGPRRHLGRAPGARLRRPGGVRRAHAGSAPDRAAAGGRAGDGGRPARGAGRRHHRARSAQEPRRGAALPRRLARRHRLRADLRPHGGRRHRRDLSRPGVAVAAPRGAARERATRHCGAGAANPGRIGRKPTRTGRCGRPRRFAVFARGADSLRADDWPGVCGVPDDSRLPIPRLITGEPWTSRSSSARSSANGPRTAAGTESPDRTPPGTFTACAVRSTSSTRWRATARPGYGSCSRTSPTSPCSRRAPATRRFRKFRQGSRP